MQNSQQGQGGKNVQQGNDVNPDRDSQKGQQSGNVKPGQQDQSGRQGGQQGTGSSPQKQPPQQGSDNKSR